MGISAEVLRGESGRVQPLDHCRLKDGERCAYFERCVLPGIPKKDRGTFHYGVELEKMAILAQRNQQVTEAKSPTRTVGIKKSKSPKKLLKTGPACGLLARGSSARMSGQVRLRLRGAK